MTPPLPRLLVIGVLLINLLVLGMVALFLQQSKSQYQEQAQINGANLARVLERTLSGNFQTIEMALLAAADEHRRLAAQGPVDRQLMNAYLARNLSRLPEVTALRIANARGEVIYGVAGNSLPPPSAADRDYFTGLRDHPDVGLFISKPTLGRISNKWLIFLARRLSDSDGQFAGVVFAAVDLKHFLKLFASVDVGPNGSVTLRDGDFSILARVPEPGGLGSTIGERKMPPLLRQEILSGHMAGVVHDFSAVDGKARLFAYRRAPETRFLVLVGQSDEDILAQWRRELTYGIVLCLSFLAISALFSWQIHRSWWRQLAAAEALRKAGVYTRSLIEASLDPLLAVAVDGRITDVNSATEALTGMARSELIGRLFASLFSQPLRAQQAFDAALRDGKAQGFELELCRGQEGLTPVLFNASVYLDEQGATMGVFSAARDITERKRFEGELRQMNATLEKRVRDRTVKLEQAMADLESFSYTTSHDLRAPLRAINGFAHILLDSYRKLLPADAVHMLDRIAHNAIKLGQLIDDVLAYSRAGRLELKQESVNLAELVSGLLGDLSASYPQTRVVIAPLPTVQGDATMLRQVFQNLLDNACKFSGQRAAPEIHVTVSDQAGERVFTVTDNGVGFDPAYAKRLFGMFQRIHPDSQFPGTGVGLAIVKRLIERHGGRIWAESDVGQGAAFHFVLEARAEAAEEGESAA